MKQLLSFLLFITLIPASAQKQASNWFFGANAGISFATNPPAALKNGQLNTMEGCASISDKQGKLLFYTDGTTIWNKKHQAMTNGKDLKGGSSATQSSLIVPWPGNPGKYFVFTIDEAEHDLANGLNYSVVNINKPDDLGEVINKNVLLLDSAAEKLTAVRHRNTYDFWVVAHHWRSNKIYTYPITSQGVGQPVISSSGTTLNGRCVRAIGHMKFSPDGKKLAITYWLDQKAELYNFNSQTGQITGLITLPIHTCDKLYGTEFSPDNKKLYVSEYGKQEHIYQFDLEAGSGTSQDILNSITIVAEGSIFGALQLAPDGRIYVAQLNGDSLGVINNPNALGKACGYKSNGIYLGGRKSKLGLPNFICSFFTEPVISDSNMCYGSFTSFKIHMPDSARSVRWDFGDASTGKQNIGYDSITRHRYSAEGVYKVTVFLLLNNGYTDTLFHSVHIVNGTKPDLGPDIDVCYSNSFQLSLPSAFSSIQWSTGPQDTLNTLTITKSGTYMVKAKSGECYNADTVDISFRRPETALPSQVTLCNDDSILVDAGNAGYHYAWNSGDTTQQLWIKQSGVYTVTLRTETCRWKQSVEAIRPTSNIFSLGNDTTICAGQVLPLSISLAGTEYTWSTGQSANNIAVSQQGIYIASVRTTCGFISDTLVVKIAENPVVASDTLKRICNNAVDLDAGNPGYTYEWNTGETTQHVQASDLGTYQVTVSNGYCKAASSFTVKSGCPVKVWVPNAFTPNADNLNNIFLPTTSGEITTYMFEVYNRWGEKIFISTTPTDGWDGTFQGKNCPDGIYFWKLSCVGYNAAINQSGSVTLLR